MIDAAAERAVLAGIFSGGHDTYVDVADILTPECFQCDNNSAYFKILVKGLQEPDSKVDIPTFFSLAKGLNLENLFENIEEQKYLRALSITPVEKTNIRKLSVKLLKLQKIKEFSRVLGGASNDLGKLTGDESIGDILSIGEGAVFDFVSSFGQHNDSVQHISKDLNEYVQYLIDNPNQSSGLSSGMPIYDEAIGGGFQKGSVNIIGARPKVGKTMLADNIALHVAGKLGVPVLNLDTEMSAKEHWNRMLANISAVEINKIKNGEFSTDITKKNAVLKASKELGAMPYHYVSIAGQPFEETLGLMRRWLYKSVGFEADGKQAKPCLVIFDYIKLMSDASISKNVSEFQALGFLMTNLHNFAIKYSLPVLAFIQLNRDGIDREDTDVASGSDRIIWLCTNFSIYKFKSPDEIAAESDSDHGHNYNLKLVPVVTRHGAGLEKGDYINVYGHYKYGRITEGPLRSDIIRDGGTRPRATKKQKPAGDDKTINFG